ncbi:hypothetical protein RIB2604_03501720 [Aspergillus luchuensis]|uniref:Uncharacterized protein n=1 Tax=Aspergillus kawachii TaxID=1069201 RepID=A0A146G0G1_ASPKA|nr:hypothetical protein RIB2604_03501720 [Aspergillus luchuensis]
MAEDAENDAVGPSSAGRTNTEISQRLGEHDKLDDGPRMVGI